MRRRILRQATLWTYGYLVLAVFVAVAGAALVAWILTIGGLPFLFTWLIVSLALLLVPLVVLAAQAAGRRWRR